MKLYLAYEFLESLVVFGHNNTWNSETQIASAAEKGNPKAQLILGWYYYIGHGMTPNKSIAAKCYQKAAAKGLPEAKRLLELLQAQPDRQMIIDMVNEGWPTGGRWKSISMVFLLIIATVIIASISYHYWPEHQQPLAAPEDVIIPTNQHMSIENEPNRYMDKIGVTAENIKLVHPITIELDHNESSARTKELRPIVETTGQEAISDSNSSVRDPNSIPSPKSKSIIEELAEIADKWLEE